MPDSGFEPAEGTPSPEDVIAQVEKILLHPEFAGSKRIQDFLRFIVEETLAGRAEGLKGYSIGVEVFGREESFDPQIDPIVRVEAGRPTKPGLLGHAVGDTPQFRRGRNCRRG